MPTHKPVAFLAFLLLGGILLARPANADSLQITFTSPTDQSVVVGSSLTQLEFDGFITNETKNPITFELITPSPESPFVASVMSPFPFPGITLGAGDSTSLQTLVTVTFNLFDPSLAYPGVANIVLDVETPQGDVITQGNLEVHILSTVPEPPSLVCLAFACLGVLFVGAVRRRVSDLKGLC